MLEIIQKQLDDSVKLKLALAGDLHIKDLLIKAVGLCIESYRHGGRVFCAGNGGSAADAQHIVAELVSRFYYDRPALAAEALTVNTSTLTAIGNDYSYDYIFARQIEANARAGDIFIAISTSGNSKNILAAVNAARSQGVKVIGLTGQSGGQLAPLCDLCFKMPSTDTPRIQEGHIVIGHIMCALVEQGMYPKRLEGARE